MSSIDRLSGLPDEVICHILSFLPTKISASTDRLAKRWRLLWTHVPNLEFAGDDFEDKLDPDIIHRVIVLHQANTINTLSLSDVNCTGYQLATWIAYAINRAVRNLYIHFTEDHIDSTALFTLPRCLFTCKTLVDLKLYGCRGIPSSGKVFLPSLKKLHLGSIQYKDDESLPGLLSGCPVLEELIVDGCSKENKNDHLGWVFVSSPTIKILNVDIHVGCLCLKINAPSLVYLKVTSLSLEYIKNLRNTTSLIEADFYLWGDVENIRRPIDYYTIAVKLLNRLCNLKCLKISTEKAEKLINFGRLDSLVKFDNLTKLKFDLIYDWHELVKFLEVADNLEVLTFTLSGKHYTYREPKLVPTCMLSSLKTVRANQFYVHNKHDFETIRYLLRNARVLERIEIHIHGRSNMKRLEMIRRISLLEQGSESCKLFFY